MRKLGRVLAVLFAVVALSIGLVSIFTEVEAKGPCICPMIYAPVVCDNGKTYPNQCVADCRHAKNCVPAGIFL